uniref:SH3 domain-containing protein n=1 Tax=Periophthalmus magnuspinnatus TaxID=409849 RepID=A0A3B4AVD8_9GOBI
MYSLGLVLVEFEYQYRGRDGDLIQIRPNERYELLTKTNAHWWQVRTKPGSKPFYIPAKYVRELPHVPDLSPALCLPIGQESTSPAPMHTSTAPVPVPVPVLSRSGCGQTGRTGEQRTECRPLAFLWIVTFPQRCPERPTGLQTWPTASECLPQGILGIVMPTSLVTNQSRWRCPDPHPLTPLPRKQPPNQDGWKHRCVQTSRAARTANTNRATFIRGAEDLYISGHRP